MNTEPVTIPFILLITNGNSDTNIQTFNLTIITLQIEYIT